LALSQEHLPLAVFLMGLYLVFLKKRKRFGAIVAASSLAYLLATLFVFMPAFSSLGAAVLVNTDQYTSRYAWLGGSVPEMVKNILTKPFFVLQNIFLYEKVKYVFFLLLPTVFLALFSWPIVFIFFLVLINLLSADIITFSVNSYHSAIFAPFIFLAAIYALERKIFEVFPIRKFFVGGIFFLSLLMFVIFGVTPVSDDFSFSDFVPSDHAKLIREVQKKIPPEASLSVQHNLGPHFTGREKVFRYPEKIGEAEFVLVDETNPFKESSSDFFTFAYALQMDEKEWKRSVEEMKKNPQYELVWKKDGYLLFKIKR
jgi:hypothetical protein